MNADSPLPEPDAPAKAPPFSTCARLLRELQGAKILRPQDWHNLPADQRDALERQPDTAALLADLVSRQLLTEYQAARISIGKSSELVLGNYRILDCLGSGGMGVVLKAEHLHMQRLVAIKLLRPASRPEILLRFASEIRALAQLHHPNIVFALDAGQVSQSDPGVPALHYLVMEYVPGQDLQEYVKTQGPLPIEKACDLIYQMAAALGEVHKHQRVHRDIKPANVRVTPEGQAKLLDFGLTRDFLNPITEVRTVLGSLEYLAPEQARDAHGVDIRADIFGLGGILYWCLTARNPFPMPPNLTQAFKQRQTQPPPTARLWRPELPEALDQLLGRLMALNPDDRPSTPQAVMRALLPFLSSVTREAYFLPAPQQGLAAAALPAYSAEAMPHLPRILIVDDEPGNRMLCRQILQIQGIPCDEAGDGVQALTALAARPYDMVILDIDMPRMKGTEVLKRLRENPPSAYLKIMMLSGGVSGDEMAQMLAAGATDYLTKPFTVVQMVSRVQAALQLKLAQDRSDLLSRNLLTINQALEKNLHARDIDLVRARDALVLSLAELVAQRDTETGAHLLRLQHYSRRLAEEAVTLPVFAGQIDLNFIDMLQCCAPLHDIGKAGVPDAVLLKPGKLTPPERAIMETHTTIGAAVLQKAAAQYPSAVAFFHMAIEIARHHHERYDGAGYPDHLVGNAIPLAARILALADVYDALRSRRSYKSAMPHEQALEIMTQTSHGHFDPVLFQVFLRCAPRMNEIFEQYKNDEIV